MYWTITTSSYKILLNVCPFHPLHPLQNQQDAIPLPFDKVEILPPAKVGLFRRIFRVISPKNKRRSIKGTRTSNPISLLTPVQFEKCLVSHQLPMAGSQYSSDIQQRSRMRFRFPNSIPYDGPPPAPTSNVSNRNMSPPLGMGPAVSDLPSGNNTSSSPIQQHPYSGEPVNLNGSPGYRPSVQFNPLPLQDNIFHDFSLASREHYPAYKNLLHQRIEFQFMVRLGYGKARSVLQQDIRVIETASVWEQKVDKFNTSSGVIRPYLIEQPDNLPLLSPLFPNSEARLFADVIQAMVCIIGLQRSCYLLENANVNDVPGATYAIQRVPIPSPQQPPARGNQPPSYENQQDAIPLPFDKVEILPPAKVGLFRSIFQLISPKNKRRSIKGTRTSNPISLLTPVQFEKCLVS
jgi:hypothetical protein